MDQINPPLADHKTIEKQTKSERVHVLWAISYFTQIRSIVLEEGIKGRDQ